MFKKIHLQLISVLLLLFVSSNIVVTSIDVYAKSKNTLTELKDSEESAEADNFEEDIDENDISDFHFPVFFSSTITIVPIFQFTNTLSLKKNENVWKLDKRKPKTPIFIQNNQLKISC